MTLETYIDATYGQVKSQLGWDSTDLGTIIAKALQLYGVDTEAEATDTTKAEKLTDFAVWRQALNDVSMDYAFSADGRTLHREQAVQHIRDNMNDAYRLAMEYMPEYQIVIHQDPTNADWYEEQDAADIS